MSVEILEGYRELSLIIVFIFYGGRILYNVISCIVSTKNLNHNFFPISKPFSTVYI